MAAPGLRSLFNAVTGRGGSGLLAKREYHRQREAAESQARATADWFRANRCPCCGASVEATLTTPQGARFAQCPDDGTVFAQPVPTPEALNWLQNHPSQSWPFLRGVRRERVFVVPQVDELAALERLLPANGARGRKLLDVGCGAGGFLLAARDRYEARGVDVHLEAVAAARSNGLSVEVAAAEEFQTDERYDIVALICVLEHSADPSKMLDACRGLLAPGGCVYVVTPNIGSASFGHLGARHSHLSSLLNLSLFTFSGLESLSRRCGFEVVAHEESGGRDLSLSDLVFFRLAQPAFRHRMTFYRPRLHHAFETVEHLVPASLFPNGAATFQRAVLVKR